MFKYFINALIVLSLAVWIGSLVFFGAAVAPTLFNPVLIPSRTMSGALNSAILGRLGTIEIVSGLLLFGSSFYAAVKYRGWANWGVVILSIGMLTTAYYYTNILFPRMNELRVSIGQFDEIPAEKVSMKEEFDSGHKLYSGLVKLVLGAGVVAMLLHNLSLVGYTESGSRRRLGDIDPVKRPPAGMEPLGVVNAGSHTPDRSGAPVVDEAQNPVLPHDKGNKEVAIKVR